MRPLFSFAIALAAVTPLSAQIPLDRPPNLGGTWVPDRGVVQFNFVHRFYVTPAPSRAVINAPTFTFATGIVSRVGAGIRYSTRSEVPGQNNELEAFVRWRPLDGKRGPWTLAVSPTYNVEAQSVDGEIQADWTRGRVTLSAAARAMSSAYGADRSRTALAGGAAVRLNPYVALGGDFASLLDQDPGEEAAWSAGLLFVIPGSPHMFSLHASNVGVNTIQGSSRRGSLSAVVRKVLYGFEFTIPLHLQRFAPWFGGGTKPVATGTVGTPVAAEVSIGAFRYQADTITVAAGQAVRWTNDDPVEHTVTFEGGGITGSQLLPARSTFTVRFERPGTYVYHCTPHPYMKGVVIVK